jgi:hypothetical protein
MPDPDPPVNVRLIYADKSEVPVDTVYDGQDKSGIHHWHVLDPPRTGRIVRMKIDALPARTSVSIRMSKP